MLFISNWNNSTFHGPGRKLTIMARPRRWEHGIGRVPTLIPEKNDLFDVRSGGIDLIEYRERFVRNVLSSNSTLSPGSIPIIIYDDTAAAPVLGDGDTLCCSCAVDAAMQGKCHRVWAAELLRRAGWTVMLDGKDLAGVREEDGLWIPLHTKGQIKLL